MTAVQKIRTAIKAAGGLNKFSSYDRRTRPLGCPEIKNMKPILKKLSKEEIYIAFRMGLIGNNNKKGTIVSNSFAK